LHQRHLLIASALSYTKSGNYIGIKEQQFFVAKIGNRRVISNNGLFIKQTFDAKQ
jgi:hypothetical protein